MAMKDTAFGTWGAQALCQAGQYDNTEFFGARLGDLRLGLAALLGTLERLGDYPEGEVAGMHAAAERLAGMIEAIEKTVRHATTDLAKHVSPLD